MKIRSYDELEQKIREEWLWRQHEIDNTINLSIKAKHSGIETICRYGVALAYAHWEGFVKKSSGYYLLYAHSKKRKLTDYKENIYALTIYKKIKSECPEKINFNSILSILSELENESFDLGKNIHEIIDTGSNLDFEKFKTITKMVGIDIKKFELKEKFINYRLLGNRNAICHGEKKSIDKNDFQEISKTVLDMLSLYKTELLNLAATKHFYRAN